MSSKVSTCALIVVGVISIVNLGLWISDHLNASDTNVSLTPFVAEQNNLYPNGKFTNVGTHATSERLAPTASPSALWIQGGGSSVTNSTGRWAA